MKMAFSTSASSGIREGMLLGLGNPLLDISIQGDKSFLDKYDLLPNNAIIAEDKHHNMFAEMTDKYSPSYLAGGATQNSIRVAQWLLEKPDATTFFGGVGADQFCKIQEEKAREVGVHVCYQVHQGMKTGVCGAIITGENRSLVTELGAAEMFSLDYLELPENWKFVEKAQFYYIGGFLLPVSPASVLKVLKHAADKKKTVIMNLHATFLCKYFTDADLDVMPYVDVLFGNGDEAAEFSKHAGFGTSSVEEIASKTAALPKINSSRCRTVVYTQGRDPTYLAHDGKVSVYPVKPVDPSVIKDTNGCGDSFVGGFLSQLVQGRSIDECVRCGSYAAKAVIQHYGCTFPPKPDFK
ncbi:adenosine kinase 1-like isoform X2 [Haliotis rufescens]|uniref:adenosine kinase 1-like isoform X2 n=1 Tax=Haliotis rufescens TaxID=6454 RepID=UPI00201F484F|nr:adenosine kinase 1-like isoform X2 [Haliotis rufescens]